MKGKRFKSLLAPLCKEGNRDAAGGFDSSLTLHPSPPTRRPTRRGFGGILLAGFIASALAGCGFQLRGQSSLPFETLYVTSPPGLPLTPDIKRAINASSQTRLTDNPKEAQATLQIISAVNEKHILSLSGGGRVREFQLRYRVSFRLYDAKSQDLIPTSEIFLKRDFSFNDTQVLAKESEEALLYQDMQRDAVQQIMRRLAAVRL